MSAPAYSMMGAIAIAVVAGGLLWSRRSPSPAASDPGEDQAVRDLKLPIRTLQVGPARIQALLLEGQSSLTYRGEIPGKGPCFVKMPNRLCLTDPDGLKRFARESRLLDTLKHANIVNRVEAGEVSDRGVRIPYLLLEYHEGYSLTDYLEGQGPLEVAQACRMVSELASVLDCLHSAGVIHRNLGPEAFWITSKGRLLVQGFGGARALSMETITLHGQIVGTVEYIAPEQIYGKQIDAQADLYALGVFAYRLLTGRSPFEYSSIAGLVKIKNEEEGPHPGALRQDLPEGLDNLVSLLMSRDPDRRPGPARRLVDELAPYLVAPA